jgi:hypothetical protein
MRTKALLLAAALTAAGIASTMAQSNVYSLNVVGYVNVTMVDGFTLVSTPLNNANNAVSNLLANAPLDTTVYTFSGGNFVLNNLDLFGGGWQDPTQDLSPGKGYFVRNVSGGPYTNTYVGEVLQGTLTVTLGSGFTLVGSKVPQAGFYTDLGGNADQTTFGLDDTIYRFAGGNFILYNNDLFGGGWSGGPPAPDTAKGPLIGVAEGFFYRNVSGNAAWVRTFTVPQ